MTSVALQPAPRARRVFRTDLQSTWSAVMAVIVGVAGVTLAAVTAMVIEIVRWDGPLRQRPSFVYSGENAWMPAVIGLVLPFIVWRAEEPRRRFYHWAMPMNRGVHTLLKTASGWTWLMALTAFYIAVLFVLNTVTVHVLGAPDWIHQPQGWEWLVPFTAGTITYLLISAAVIGSNLPIAAIGVVIAAYTIPMLYAEGYHKKHLAAALNSIVSGRYGLSAGAFGILREYGPVGYSGRTVMYGPIGLSIERWLGASAIWIGVGLALTVIVALKHRDS